MKRDLAQLSSKPFDLVVVGGGIFGACAAWDAVQRGLTVALIDRSDFGSAASANSFKLIHGGIRYIQHGDVARVRQSANERRTLMRIAPHLVHPLPIVIPTYGRGMKGKSALRVGMGIYDLLTWDRNQGVEDPERHVPSSGILSLNEVLTLFPELNRNELTGAAMFRDGQMYNPPRLVLAFIQKAVGAGAVAANYVEATGFLRKDDRITGVIAHDTLSGANLEIQGRVVLNTTGPYAESLLRRAMSLRLSPPGAYSRDAFFVVPRRLLHDRFALAVQAKTKDPDALVSRGERHLFIVPWRHYTLIGTWHKVHTDDPDAYSVTEGNLQGFFDEINAGYPALRISFDDVSFWNAGLIPFGENPRDAADLRFAHRSRLVDHAETHGLDNLISLIGVRFTTGRCEAAQAVNRVFEKLGIRPPASRTADLPIQGGDFVTWSGLVRRIEGEHGASLGADVVQSLAHNYGSDCGQVCRHMTEHPDLGERLGTSATIKAQVVHAIRSEMAQTLSDIIFRRTDLATGEYPGPVALEQCAEILRSELSLSHEEISRQIDAVTARFPRWALQKAADEAQQCGVAGVPVSPRHAGG